LDVRASILKDVCHKLSLSVPRKEHNKQGWSSCIVNVFESRCIDLIGKTTSELKHLLSSLDIVFEECNSDFYVLLALYLQYEFSDLIFFPPD
jgi:hypothetical protein